MNRDILNAAAIKEAIPDIPAKVLVLTETDSTNTQLKKMSMQGAPNATVLFAEQQTTGHGRMGRSFFSPAGSGLYFSYLFRTELPPQRIIRLTAAVSVALCRAIDRVCGCQTKIKWINDLYLSQRKICGILTDSVINPKTGRFEFIVIGVGLNVNTPQACFPAELQEKAGSIFSITGQRTDRERLAAEIIREFQALPTMLEKDDFLDIYRKRSCVLGQKVCVFGAGMNGEEAVAESIDENGFLLVREGNGKTHLLNSGEITLRPAKF